MIDLPFDSPPSAKGWTFDGAFVEADVYSTTGNSREMDTIGMGQDGARYSRFDVPNSLEPVTIGLDAAIYDEEISDLDECQAFGVSIVVQELGYSVLFGPTGLRISDGTGGGGIPVDLDATQRHEYVIVGTPGVATFTVAVDGGTPVEGIPNVLLGRADELTFGDGSSMGNGDVEFFGFASMQPIPEPGTGILVALGLVGFATRGKKST